jgi:very-short-patch-repair endonuclease
MANDFYAAVSTLVAEFQDKLKVIVERDGSRHMMDAHIDFSTMGLLEDELLPYWSR